MCFNFSRMLMRNIAIDFGTVNTLIAIKGRGIVLHEPSAVAIASDGQREPLAFGGEAMRMLGRTPGGINVVYPMRDGVVADYELSAEMLKCFIQMALGHKVGALGVRLVLCLPLCVTEVERRALAEAARGAGARDVLMLDEPLAAAVGAELPVFEPVGSMVADIGGGTTDVAVLALGGIAASASVRTGGTHLDAAIREHVQKAHGVMIGERMAEEIKITIGNAMPGGTQRMQVRGRKLDTGLPTSLILNAGEIAHAIAPAVSRIIAAIKDALSVTPPELAGDLYSSGITLTGGGAQLQGLDKLVAQETGMPVYVEESPLDCVALGALRMLDRQEAFTEVAHPLEA